MAAALADRQNYWKRLRDEISTASNINFFSALQARGFRGHLTYDHENQELNISVIAEHSATDVLGVPEHRPRDIKQLSGGEKSFGTSCFLLSLWEAMGCPFRCLDEFDVYMVKFWTAFCSS
jgi:chromosome segregation ATPase